MLTVIIYFSTYLPWLPSACLTGGAIYMALRGMGFSCMYSCCYRGKLRQQYSLPGTDCYDCLIHCFCERCSLCQMHRELKNRGFNMEIGVFISLLFRSHLHTLQQAPLPPSPPPPLLSESCLSISLWNSYQGGKETWRSRAPQWLKRLGRKLQWSVKTFSKLLFEKWTRKFSFDILLLGNDSNYQRRLRSLPPTKYYSLGTFQRLVCWNFPCYGGTFFIILMVSRRNNWVSIATVLLPKRHIWPNQIFAFHQSSLLIPSYIYKFNVWEKKNLATITICDEDRDFNEHFIYLIFIRSLVVDYWP